MEKILVVNNDFDTMELLKKCLERKKYKVKFTGNEDEVPDIIKSFEPDLLLVDVLQEVVAKKVRSAESTKTIPILLMTGYTNTSRTFAKEDVDDIIEKPFQPAVLEMKIRKLLKETG